jgi:hypothetical protein
MLHTVSAVSPLGDALAFGSIGHGRHDGCQCDAVQCLALNFDISGIDLGSSAPVVHWGYPPIMKARQVIDGASFGPDALKAIGRAFDEAWAQIAANIGDDPEDIDKARYRLATAMLSVAKEDSRDVEALKGAVLEEMAPGYRNRTALKNAGLEVMRIRYRHRIAN